MNKRPNIVFISTSLLLSLLLLGGAFVRAVPASAQDKSKAPGTAEVSHSQERLMNEVRHQLVMLPYYTVFDNLAYEVNGSTVTLVGQVVKPALKSDAGSAVKRIEGVENVVNNIEVLPLSPNDDRIRRNVYRAIYSFPSLQRYQLQAVPPIHIIVKNGHVTLAGVVANEGDKNAANIRANTVSGVFSVTNNLTVEKK